MDTDLSDDLMIGAKAVAGFLGVPVRQVFYMAENAQLPLFKIGGKWAGLKSTIAKHIRKLETAVRADEATLLEDTGSVKSDQPALADEKRTNATALTHRRARRA
jgi:hypothetical protein